MFGEQHPEKPIYSVFSDDPFYSDLLELFVVAIPDRIQHLKTSAQRCDWEEVRRTVHQFKGSAASYGFGTISLAAAELEQAIRNRTPESVLAEMTEAFCKLCCRVRSRGADQPAATPAS